MSQDDLRLDHSNGSPIFRGDGSPIFTHLRDGLSQVTEVLWAMVLRQFDEDFVSEIPLDPL